jgi:HK97 family phage major capsid protein
MSAALTSTEYKDFREGITLMRQWVEEAEAEKAARGSSDAILTDQIKRIDGRLDTLDLALRRPSLGGPLGVAEQPERKAFERALRVGVANLDAESKSLVKFASASEAKALSNTDDSAGGFLAPAEYVTEIIKAVQLLSPMRDLARIRTTSNRSVQIPVRKGTFAAAWVAEVGTRTETTGLKYGREEVPAHELYAEVIISEQDLEDSAFDMEAEIRAEAAEQIAIAEAKAFINGTGVGQPEGFLQNATLVANFVANGGATLTSADKLIDLWAAVKTAYASNATWTMNRATLAAVRKLKDSQNRYIWEPGLAPGNPSTIIERPYVEMPDMPDIASNALPIAFGDFRRAYSIVDRVQVVVKRLNEKYADTGQIAFIVRKRTGGQLVLAEAIKALKMA